MIALLIESAQKILRRPDRPPWPPTCSRATRRWRLPRSPAREDTPTPAVLGARGLPASANAVVLASTVLAWCLCVTPSLFSKALALLPRKFLPRESPTQRNKHHHRDRADRQPAGGADWWARGGASVSTAARAAFFTGSLQHIGHLFLAGRRTPAVRAGSPANRGPAPSRAPLGLASLRRRARFHAPQLARSTRFSRTGCGRFLAPVRKTMTDVASCVDAGSGRRRSLRRHRYRYWRCLVGGILQAALAVARWRGACSRAVVSALASSAFKARFKDPKAAFEPGVGCGHGPVRTFWSALEDWLGKPWTRQLALPPRASDRDSGAVLRRGAAPQAEPRARIVPSNAAISAVLPLKWGAEYGALDPSLGAQGRH